MKLRNLGSNQTLLQFNDGSELFFSYETPVAGRNHDGYFRTEEKFSTTTSRHINAYLRGVHGAKEVSQAAIELFVAICRCG